MRDVLLPIHRAFSKDEAVSHLMDVNRQLMQENGILKSEIDELKHLLSMKSKTERDQYISGLLAQIESMRRTKNEYKRQLIEWMNRYYETKRVPSRKP
jgi:oligoribonuclease (3'-5' exoribonuclease)